MPRIPKPEAIRQRQNRSTTRALLPTEQQSAARAVPELPARVGGWHPMVVEWWRSVWRSPMASEYLDTDLRGGLFLLADLHQVRWTATSPAALISVAGEIRLQEVRFGLSPIDRRRLEWEVEKPEATDPVPAERRQMTGAPSSADPRKVLKIS